MMLISLEHPGNFSWSTKSLSQVEEKTFSYKYFHDFHRGERKKDKSAFCVRYKGKSVTSIAVLSPCRDPQKKFVPETEAAGPLNESLQKIKTVSLRQKESIEIHRKKERMLTLLAKKPQPNPAQ